MNDESEFLKIAKHAALAGGEVVKKYRHLELHTTQKTHANDIATEGDIETEKVVVEILKKNFPKHSILAEESGRTENNSDYTWVIDPIDGTLSFLFGMPFYSVAIGLLYLNKPVLGVINVVGMNDLYWAEENKGAFVNGSQIKVSSRTPYESSVMIISFGNNVEKRRERFEKRILPFLHARYVYASGGACFELCAIARGFADGVIISAKPWDFAAGAIILKEAGGRVTDFKGNELDFTKNQLDVVASNGLIHEEILKIHRAQSKN